MSWIRNTDSHPCIFQAKKISQTWFPQTLPAFHFNDGTGKESPSRSTEWNIDENAV
jgi:hypothetical protein